MHEEHLRLVRVGLLEAEEVALRVHEQVHRVEQAALSPAQREEVVGERREDVVGARDLDADRDARRPRVRGIEGDRRPVDLESVAGRVRMHASGSCGIGTAHQLARLEDAVAIDVGEHEEVVVAVGEQDAVEIDVARHQLPSDHLVPGETMADGDEQERVVATLGSGDPPDDAVAVLGYQRALQRQPRLARERRSHAATAMHHLEVLAPRAETADHDRDQGPHGDAPARAHERSLRGATRRHMATDR